MSDSVVISHLVVFSHDCQWYKPCLVYMCSECLLFMLAMSPSVPYWCTPWQWCFATYSVCRYAYVCYAIIIL